MLYNDTIDYIVLRNFGDDHEGLGDQEESKEGPSQVGGPSQLGFD
jgi:hypothetical protein